MSNRKARVTLHKKVLLDIINELMSIKQEDITPKSIQLVYPLLHMFYNLAVNGKLFPEIIESKGEPPEQYPEFDDEW